MKKFGKGISTKILLLFFAALFISMAGITGISILNISKGLNSQMMQQAQVIGEQIKSQVSTGTMIDSDIDKLLEDTLYDTAYSIAFMDIFSNEALEGISKSSGVAEINVANENGVIIYSNMPANLGYVYGENHAVHKILTGEYDRVAEKTRKSDVDNKFYKYAAVKVPGKNMVIQVGISADYMETVKQKFSIQSGLEKYKNNENILYVYVVDNSNTITAHSDSSLIGKKSDEEAKVNDVIKNNKEYSEVQYNKSLKKNVYNILIPLQDSNGTAAGVIDIGVSMASVENAVSSLIVKSIVFSLLALFITLGCIYFIIKRMVEPISILSEAAESVAEGDLSSKVNVSSSDEIGQLANSFNLMVNNLKTLINAIITTTGEITNFSGELLASAEQTTATAQQVASATDEMAKGSMEQVNMTDKIKGSIDGISGVINEVTQGVEKVQKSSDYMISISKQSRSEMAEMKGQIESIRSSSTVSNETIKELTKAFSSISEIINVINSIASQTNLLALNAAIEAARAGEHGRGFSVVAEEVRKLAEESSISAGNISQLIKETQSKSESAISTIEESLSQASKGQAIVDKVSQSFENIIDSVDNTHNMFNNIAKLCSNLNQQAGEISKLVNEIESISQNAAANTQEVSASTEEQVAASQQITSSIENLNSLSENLKKMAGKFKI